MSAVSVTCGGALEGLGKGVPSLWISLMRYIIVIIPMAFILSRAMSSQIGVWIAFPVTEFIAAKSVGGHLQKAGKIFKLSYCSYLTVRPVTKLMHIYGNIGK